MQSMSRYGGWWIYEAWNTAWAVLPVLLVVLAVRPCSARELRRFVDRHGVEVSPEIRPAMTRLIERSRMTRLICASIGFSLVPLCFALGIDIPNQSFEFGVAGYLVGAFVAAVAPIERATTKRRALLVPRRPGDYLPRWMRFAPLAAVTISVAATIVFAVEPRTALPSISSASYGLPEAVIAAVATVIAVRVIVARPQPLGTPDLVSIDDALRSQATHTIAGAGIAVALSGAAECLINMGGYSEKHWIHTIGVVGGLVVAAAALIAWVSCTGPWRVSRPLPP